MARIARWYRLAHLQNMARSRLTVGAIRTAETILTDWGKRGIPEAGTGGRAQEFGSVGKYCLPR
jgi:hypothetical protein